MKKDNKSEVKLMKKTCGKFQENSTGINPDGPSSLSSREIRALLIAVKGNPFQEAVIQLLLHTGIRRDELLNLRFDSIDLRARTLTIYSLKTDGVRTIPLGDVLPTILAKLLEFRVTPHGKNNTAFIARKAHQKTFLFCDHRGEPFNRDVLNFFDHLGVKAGLSKRLTTNLFRSTFTENLMNSGQSVYEVARLLGHRVANNHPSCI